MNKNTDDFITDRDFSLLYDKLFATHNPTKANIGEEELMAIGLVVVKFQRLEHTVISFIRLLSNLGCEQQVFDIFIAKHSFKNSITMLISLAIHKEFHRLDDLRKLTNMANKAEDIRNQLLHSVWTSGPRMKIDINQKNGLIHKFESYSKGELLQIAEQVNKVDTAIDAIKFDYIEHCQNNGIRIGH